MFSNSSKYAVKAVLYLAANSTSEYKVMVKDIAEPINVPQAYIAKLLQQLVHADIVSSARGPKGGFYLNSNNLEASIMDIIVTIDGDDKLLSCMLSLENCNKNKPCPLHHILSASKNTVLKNLNNLKIKDAADQIITGKSFLPL
ncbi:Rrf2 family transcriptional regulator [Seonamhaeicola sp. ML3]|uniref:RrF2 family transcriptional regulator n=1 Tax=Seonamhaeicola sp. ML3 TaxID=2937786 RepID=UPI00200FFF29|nr:Rrf2 family transcriptional regulator [Seonamhaeicola sp. ML3]